MTPGDVRIRAYRAASPPLGPWDRAGVTRTHRPGVRRGTRRGAQPCGFALLPAYLTFVIGDSAPGRPVAVARALRRRWQ